MERDSEWILKQDDEHIQSIMLEHMEDEQMTMTRKTNVTVISIQIQVKSLSISLVKIVASKSYLLLLLNHIIVQYH